jgi:hypothetical protein
MRDPTDEEMVASIMQGIAIPLSEVLITFGFDATGSRLSRAIASCVLGYAVSVAKVSGIELEIVLETIRSEWPTIGKPSQGEN